MSSKSIELKSMSSLSSSVDQAVFDFLLAPAHTCVPPSKQHRFKAGVLTSSQQ
eukprot:m.378929 g.378929  ORF g.378929 m.378929 type:complete len:53 (+) comp20027_c4_seq14:2791-2949(+)